MAVVLLGVIALSALVGLVGGEEEFDWDLAAVFGTAVGTTLLALATGVLAFWTLQEVSATKELAALSRRDQQLRERPVVIQEDAALSFSGQQGHLLVKLMNVGLGPALRVQITANYIDPEYHAEIQRVTRPAIKPGESDRVQLYVRCPPPLPPSGVRRDGFRVSGTYLDRSRTDEYEIITSWAEAPGKPG